MNRYRLFVLLAMMLPASLHAADEGIPEQRLQALKAATVYVKVEGKQGMATGSGFLVHVDGETGLIATNRHVIAAVPGRFTPNKYSIVLWSGTRMEQVLPVEIVAINPDEDLAVLKVTAKNLPAPIDLTPTKLRETMTIYTLGFPLGAVLSAARDNPSVTIGKGTIGALPEDERGKLRHIQLDGELNPGNSGGPIVDGDGKLVGIAVAKIAGTKISFAIPPGELTEMLKGRVGAVIIRNLRINKETAELEIEAPVIDPMHKVNKVEVYYIRKDAAKAIPGADKSGNWTKLPGAESASMKIDNGKATAKIELPATDKKMPEYYFQALYSLGDGKSVYTQPVALNSRSSQETAVAGNLPAPKMKFGGKLTDDALPEKPPEGWQEYVQEKFKAYSIWLPKTGRKLEQTEGSLQFRNGKIGYVVLKCEIENDITLNVQRLILPLQKGETIDAQAAIEGFRDMHMKDVEGTIAEEFDLMLGKMPGKEYRVDLAGGEKSRVRIYQVGRAIWRIWVTGTKEQVMGDKTKLIFASFKNQILLKEMDKKP